jgi:hypothetical protein
MHVWRVMPAIDVLFSLRKRHLVNAITFGVVKG